MERSEHVAEWIRLWEEKGVISAQVEPKLSARGRDFTRHLLQSGYPYASSTRRAGNQAATALWSILSSAMATINRTADVFSNLRVKPFRRRNARAVSQAVRLFASTNAWALVREARDSAR